MSLRSSWPDKEDKMKHTKGPWYESNTGNHQGLVISESDGSNICVTYDKANARLIAAAPKMLEALNQINGLCHAGMMSNELGKHVKLEQIADIVRDLIQSID
jgi:hypothetical protein